MTAIIILTIVMRLLRSFFVIASIASSTAQQFDLTRGQLALSGGLRGIQGRNLVPREDERRLAVTGDGFDKYDGMCLKEDGKFPLTFDKQDLPLAYCRQLCPSLDWCLAIWRVNYLPDDCRLVIDLGTFEAMGETLDGEDWGHEFQYIYGEPFRSYCDSSGGPCTPASTEFGAGSVAPRDGHECWIRHDPNRRSITDENIKWAVDFWVRDQSNAAAMLGDIRFWDTSAVTDMGSLFEGHADSNDNISNWNVASVTSMYRMFNGASAFDQDISSWNVASVLSMRLMCGKALA
jgi:hypothetical protein